MRTWKTLRLANDLLQNLGRAIGFTVIAVAFDHVCIILIALGFCSKPVKSLPVIAEQTGKGISRGKRDANAEFLLRTRLAWLYQIVLMTKIHKKPCVEYDLSA